MEFLLARYNYWVFVVLMMIGLYAVMSKNNLVKKLIGLAIFQTAIILFFISTGTKRAATIPILEHGAHPSIDPSHYANPLPHVLMLTAIVVGVATLGVALAVVQEVYSIHQTLEEDEILEQLESGAGLADGRSP